MPGGSRLRTSFAIGTLSLLAAASAEGVVLYDGLGSLPVGAAHDGPGNVVRRCEPPLDCDEIVATSASDLDWAISFVAPAGTWTRTSIDAALVFLGGHAEIDVILHADALGTPGVVLETIHLSNVPGTGTVLSAPSASNPVLTGGSRYRVELSADNLADVTTTSVFRGPLGFGASPTASARQLDEGAWSGALARIGGHRIHAVPEPTTPSLALLGLGGLAALRRPSARRRDRGLRDPRVARLAVSKPLP
jgi:MYXO-CTERM domain-containing protein